MWSASVMGRTTLHGTPAANTFGGMSRVTTLPAPITLPSPIVTPPQIVTLPEIQQLSPMVIECSPAFENRVQVTECRNVQKTAGLNGRKWTRHGKLPYISYSVEKIVPGATVRYSGPLYSQSDGGTPGKSVNGEFTVEYYRNDKACGVHLEDLGWVPASDCVVMD